MIVQKYFKIAQMSAQNATNGGIALLMPSYLLKVIYLIPLLLLWRTLIPGGVDAGMTLDQMLTYTYLGGILTCMLVVHTPASNWLYEGLFISLYQRPTNVILHLVSQTVGGWVPEVVLLTIPMLLFASVAGIHMIPVSLWFFPGLVLCITLGFAVDFLFACMTIRMQNASWLVYSIRNAIVVLLSGSVIPFAILPWGIGNVFHYLPFGSLAGAPLSIYTGLAEPVPVILIQLLWNLVLWPLAILCLKKTQERMVSFGG